MFRRSLLQMFLKGRVLKNFPNLIGKHLCWSLQALKPIILLKRDFRTCFSCIICETVKNTLFYRTPNSFQTNILFLCPEAVARRCSVKKLFLKISQNSQENGCFPVNFAKFLRTPVFQKTSWQLLLVNADYTLKQFVGNNRQIV